MEQAEELDHLHDEKEEMKNTPTSAALQLKYQHQKAQVLASFFPQYLFMSVLVLFLHSTRYSFHRKMLFCGELPTATVSCARLPLQYHPLLRING